MNRTSRNPLIINEFADKLTADKLIRLLKENFQRLEDYLSTEVIQNAQWRLIELTFVADVVNYRFKHNLGFEPKDVIQTSNIGTGTIVYNFALFDKDYIDMTVSGTSTDSPLMVRFVLGSLN